MGGDPMLGKNRRSTHTWAEVQSIKRLVQAGFYHPPSPEQIAEAMLTELGGTDDMSVIQLPVPKEREPGPKPAGRECACGTILSRWNPGESCAPCSGGDWVAGEMSEFEIRRLQKMYREDSAA